MRAGDGLLSRTATLKLPPTVGKALATVVPEVVNRWRGRRRDLPRPAVLHALACKQLDHIGILARKPSQERLLLVDVLGHAQGVVVLLLGDRLPPCDIPLTFAEMGEQGDDHYGGEDRVQDDKGSADRIHAFASATM